eukprot:COSAG02_NODE_283_length_25709_cov_24.523311_6_plen_46_part_00
MNNAKYFTAGSAELRKLLEAGADEQLHAVFELAVTPTVEIAGVGG